MRPSSVDLAQNSSFCFIPCVASDQNVSPGSPITHRLPNRKRSPAGDRLTLQNIDWLADRSGQMGCALDQFAPPSRERDRFGTKSLTPSADCTMKLQNTSPARVTARRGPAAMAPCPPGEQR